MTDRSTELATLAVRRHEATGMPLIDSIAAAIRQALEEGRPPRWEHLIGKTVTPSEIDQLAGLMSGTAFNRLKKAVFLGHAVRKWRGHYEIISGIDIIMAPAHRGIAFYDEAG